MSKGATATDGTDPSATTLIDASALIALATFEYGDEIQLGEPHIIWRRIGTHSVFRQP
jgi:hypothetical protein